MTTIEEERARVREIREKRSKQFYLDLESFCVKLKTCKVINMIPTYWTSCKFAFEDGLESKEFNYSSLEFGDFKFKTPPQDVIINFKNTEEILNYFNSQQFQDDYKDYKNRLLIRDIIR